MENILNKIKFGKSDLLVSPITFGGNVLGWTLNEQESFKILDAFLDAGFNFIDTADAYSKWVPGNSGGESETIIGNWLRKRARRNDVTIATKLGAPLSEQKKGLSRKYIKEAVEASLARLGTDYIDLYQSHCDDESTAVSETMTGFDDVIREGKVRFIGASNLSPERIRESNQFARENNLVPYISLQPLYNLYDRQGFEKDYLPLVKEEALAVMSYYSLASGFLTGKYRSEADLNISPRGKGIKKYLNDRGFRILKAVDAVAAEHNVPVSQVSIAWLLHKPFITSPIASATNEEQLQELIPAATLKLSPGQVEQLDDASAY
jgi:aryl-alcohol dehydrogenase-like predicted oxidoreductase